MRPYISCARHFNGVRFCCERPLTKKNGDPQQKLIDALHEYFPDLVEIDANFEFAEFDTSSIHASRFLTDKRDWIDKGAIAKTEEDNATPQAEGIPSASTIEVCAETWEQMRSKIAQMESTIERLDGEVADAKKQQARGWQELNDIASSLPVDVS